MKNLINNRYYIAIDLKSFYASVECVQRNLDPLDTNLVVANESRTDKTICLAVSPSLKSFGIPGRPRLFEVRQKVKEINANRLKNAPGGRFRGKSSCFKELISNPNLALDFIIAKPQMAVYMRKSSEIYSVYLKYVASEDMHIYSVDEVFIDCTAYLNTYKTTPMEFAGFLVKKVLEQTGITATAGVGTNLYLCKIAMDIEAKHIQADENGVRIAYLDEMLYRKKLWTHRPLTDFWRIGRGIAGTLEKNYMYTMGDVARASVHNEDKLYKLFGINAELLIDHAWGYENCTIEDIKKYKPERRSFSEGQVLSMPYDHEKTKIIVREMADNLALELVEKGCVCNQIVLTICYDVSNLSNKNTRYTGMVTKDWYGRLVPGNAHGSINIGFYTSSSVLITEKALELYEKITNKTLSVRRIYLVTNNVEPLSKQNDLNGTVQFGLFDDFEKDEKLKITEEKDRRRQLAIIDLKKKFGKNAILKASDLTEGATAKERNAQVGGHDA